MKNQVGRASVPAPVWINGARCSPWRGLVSQAFQPVSVPTTYFVQSILITNTGNFNTGVSIRHRLELPKVFLADQFQQRRQLPLRIIRVAPGQGLKAALAAINQG
jgi:hypothetical protein